MRERTADTQKDPAQPADRVGGETATKESPATTRLSVTPYGVLAIPPNTPNCVQAMLTVGPVADPHEQEADRIAALVMRQMHSRTAGGGDAHPEQDHGHVADVRMRAVPGVGVGGGRIEGSTEQGIRNPGPGRPLQTDVLQRMGQAFGADFSSVRIHTDSRADAMNRELSATAFTRGRDVFFRSGVYDPSNAESQHVLAHELTHVVQQGAAGPGPELPGNGEVVRRHASPEHLALGDVGPKRLRTIPDASELVDQLKLGKLNLKSMGALPDDQKETLLEAIHVLVQERQRIRTWQKAPPTDVADAQTRFDVRALALKTPPSGPPVVATYGEMNTLADHFGSIDDLDAVSPETMTKVLQTEREDYYNYLGTLLRDLTAKDCEWVEEEQESSDGRMEKVWVAYHRSEAAYADPKGFYSAPYNQRGGVSLEPQGFEGTQSGFFTAGFTSWVTGMEGIDTAIAADEGTKARGSGGVWGAIARNACHFAPESWYAWKRYHQRARDLAGESYALKQQAANENDADAKKRLEEEAATVANRAWMLNGFGDHYLQDSFASGHLVNKTLVMQWYLEVVKNWKVIGPNAEALARLGQMGEKQQPGLAARGLYSKNVDMQQSGPQMSADVSKDSTKTAFDAADLQRPTVSPDATELLRWWRTQVGKTPASKDLTGSQITADCGLAGKTQAALDELVKMGMVVDRGRTAGSFMPIWGKEDKNFRLNETPGMSHEKAKADDQEYDPVASVTFGAYHEFMQNALLQSGGGALHNYFCLEGLTVRNDVNDDLFKIYGDYVMLTKGGGKGIEVSAGTAKLSQRAIQETLATGQAGVEVEQIMAYFPSQVQVPDTFGVQDENGAWSVKAGDVLPLENWHDRLKPHLTNLFTKGVAASKKSTVKAKFKDVFLPYGTDIPGKKKLTNFEYVSPHSGAEF